MQETLEIDEDSTLVDVLPLDWERIGRAREAYEALLITLETSPFEGAEENIRIVKETLVEMDNMLNILNTPIVDLQALDERIMEGVNGGLLVFTGTVNAFYFWGLLELGMLDGAVCYSNRYYHPKLVDIVRQWASERGVVWHHDSEPCSTEQCRHMDFLHKLDKPIVLTCISASNLDTTEENILTPLKGVEGEEFWLLCLWDYYVMFGTVPAWYQMYECDANCPQGGLTHIGRPNAFRAILGGEQ